MPGEEPGTCGSPVAGGASDDMLHWDDRHVFKGGAHRLELNIERFYCSKATCVLVDAMAPLLQEQASKSGHSETAELSGANSGFPGSLMVLAETLTYFLGGLSLAMLLEGPKVDVQPFSSLGLHGVRRCFQPLRPSFLLSWP